MDGVAKEADRAGEQGQPQLGPAGEGEAKGRDADGAVRRLAMSGVVGAPP